MSTTQLERRLIAAANDLEEIGPALIATPSTMPKNASDVLEEYVQHAQALRTAAGLIAIREAGRTQLATLLANTDPVRNEVAWHGTPTPFAHARLLAFQAYLATTWAMADQIMRAVGTLMCTREGTKNPQKPPQLWSHVFADCKLSGRTGDFLKAAYGWPVAISYAIRNHCVHDGAIVDGSAFFSGNTASHRYAISPNGWKFLEHKINDEYKVNKNQTRIALPWPWHQDNLLTLLSLCHQELDDVLGVLARWATYAAKVQVGVALGSD